MSIRKRNFVKHCENAFISGVFLEADAILCILRDIRELLHVRRGIRNSVSSVRQRRILVGLCDLLVGDRFGEIFRFGWDL